MQTVSTERRGDWIAVGQGPTGPRRFWPLDPRPEEVFIADIALSLSREARYSGYTSEEHEPLSVAQHQVLVSELVEGMIGVTQCGHCRRETTELTLLDPSALLLCADCARNTRGFRLRLLTPAIRRELLLWALLHDAHEAYMGDVARPVKRMPELAGYRAAADLVQHAVCMRFGLPLEEPPIVKQADTMLLVTEARDLMSPLDPDWYHQPPRFKTWVRQIVPLPWREARAQFLARFEALWGAV